MRVLPSVLFSLGLTLTATALASSPTSEQPQTQPSANQQENQSIAEQHALRRQQIQLISSRTGADPAVFEQTFLAMIESRYDESLKSADSGFTEAEAEVLTKEAVIAMRHYIQNNGGMFTLVIEPAFVAALKDEEIAQWAKVLSEHDHEAYLKTAFIKETAPKHLQALQQSIRKFSGKLAQTSNKVIGDHYETL